ncbi:MAG TPA: glycosyltransferase family 4 protein [Casimicrobiaceae bacterium]
MDFERPLRIAQIAPLYESVPPQGYGGTERVVANLADTLVDMGHEVTLFASGDSTADAYLVAGREKALRLDTNPLKSDAAAHFAMLHEVREQRHAFDILHFHTDILHFPFFEDVAARTITTLHGRLDIADLGEVFRRWPEYPLASVSDHQRRPIPFGNWRGTVHHGIATDLFAFSGNHRGVLAFVGRIAPEKRADRAIEIARRAGMTLRVAAKVDDADRVYFHEIIEPQFDAHVDFIGEIGDFQKNELLGSAAALLFPIDWPEPFGMVMIEAMACGTPVIAWDEGAVSEIVDDGVTGFIVRSIDEAVAAVHRVDTLDRQTVRMTFERRFSAAAMSNNYLRLYAEVLRPASRLADNAFNRRENRAARGDRAVRA